MKEQQNLTTKVQKQMPEFFDEVTSLDSAALETRIVQLAKDLGEVEKAKDADEALEQARKTVKELAAPYRESRTAIRLKTSYLIQLLEEKGK